MNPDRAGENPATNRVSYGAASNRDFVDLISKIQMCNVKRGSHCALKG
jgi:hypothetical protein